jgi:hypothetical protein
MHPRNALFLMAAPAVALFLHCGSKPKPQAESASNAPEASLDAGSDADVGAGGSGAEEAAEEPPRPDPVLVKKLVDRTGQSAPDEAQSLGLRFEVVEMGPETLWGIAVVNRGAEPVLVAFDPRLLVLEIEPPPNPEAKKWAPKPKTRVCRLPDDLRPSRVDRSFALRLEPGQGMVESFDPRLYCLPEKGVSPFVEGARVSSRFGWAPKTKSVWKKGKREDVVLPQTEPFVALVAPPEKREHRHDHEHGLDHERDHKHEHKHKHDHGARASNPSSGSRAATDARDAGAAVEMAEAGSAPDAPRAVKELRGTPFVLGSEYARRKPEEARSEPLALELKSGSDARDETLATITTTLHNRSNRARQVYFRREFLSFEVSGPDGVVICDPQPDTRAPDRQAFTLLNAGGSLTSTSRLVELCPDDTFARPGLYVVNAELVTFANGAEFGFDAFVGRLVAERSVVVRIRTGSLPFPGTRTLEPVTVGSPSP